MGKLRIIAALVCTLPCAASALITTFTSEAAFRAALPASSVVIEENFNAFTSDLSLDAGASFNGFSAQSLASDSSATLTRVDNSPFQTASQHPIDGTPYIYASLQRDRRELWS